MAFVVIAGMPDCPKYAHAEYVANYLSVHLPNFNVVRILKLKEKWEKWLLKICTKNNWHHYKCPIIWKELTIGSRGILIGGLSDFLEYCYEYYGLQSILTMEEKKLLVMDNLEQYKMKQKKKHLARIQHKVRYICITGASSPIMPVLLGELLRMPCIAKKNGTVILLYDAPEHQNYLKKMILNAVSMGAVAGLGAARIVSTLKEGLKYCEILIVLDGCHRIKHESLEEWLGRNHTAMLNLASAVTEHALRKCRVILAPLGNVPLCFNATVFAEAAIGLVVRNIVAITADLGFEALATITELTKTDLVDLANPAVWGFIGINKLIDLDNMLYRASYYVPNKRALKKIPGSTLPLGEVVVELRPFIYMLHDKATDIWQQIKNRKRKVTYLLGRPSCQAKIKGIIGLLQLWYSNIYDGEVISLGVSSNDTFGIPAGMFFSQPVILVNEFWMPYSDYTEPKDTNCGLQPLYDTASYILQKFGIGQKFNAEWLLKDNEKEWKKKLQNQVIRIKAREEKNFIDDKMAKLGEEIKNLKARNKLEIEKIMNREKCFIEELVNNKINFIIEESVIPEPFNVVERKCSKEEEKEEKEDSATSDNDSSFKEDTN